VVPSHSFRRALADATQAVFQSAPSSDVHQIGPKGSTIWFKHAPSGGEDRVFAFEYQVSKAIDQAWMRVVFSTWTEQNFFSDDLRRGGYFVEDDYPEFGWTLVKNVWSRTPGINGKIPLRMALDWKLSGFKDQLFFAGPEMEEAIVTLVPAWAVDRWVRYLQRRGVSLNVHST